MIPQGRKGLVVVVCVAVKVAIALSVTSGASAISNIITTTLCLQVWHTATSSQSPSMSSA